MVSRNLTDCFYKKSSISADGNTDDLEYWLSSEEDMKHKQRESEEQGLEVEMERRLFMCESIQLMDMVEQINASSKCSTPECSGG